MKMKNQKVSAFLRFFNYFELFRIISKVIWLLCCLFRFFKKEEFFQTAEKDCALPCFLTSSKCTSDKLVSHIKGVFPSIILGDFDSANRTFRFSAGVTMDRYQKIEKNGHVGEGTYGVVYKAKDKQTDAIVALKVLNATTALWRHSNSTWQ
jgi:hypothetical protein